ncbi:hypothetical protein EON66_10735 [archaeon]|nr:MAG: hypothetical protein EON66_10735 [archaeon]
MRVQTTGPSMMPTLATDGEVVFVDCLSPALGVPIQRGDIIIAESWVKDDYKVCKRVIGLPGDYIQTQEWLPPTKVRGGVWCATSVLCAPQPRTLARTDPMRAP